MFLLPVALRTAASLVRIGLHFDGPANDITISNCDLTSGDDAIALNCPEGHTGDISRVSVDNCKFNSWSMMRLDTIQCSGCLPRNNIDTVSVTNCTGSVRQAGFLIGQGAQANPGSVTGLKISNCNITAPAVLELGASFGSIELDSVTLTASTARINPTFTSPGMGFARTSPYFNGCTYTGANLTLNNCVLQWVSDGVTAAVILDWLVYFESRRRWLLNSGVPHRKVLPNVSSLVDAKSGTVGQLAWKQSIPSLLAALPCKPVLRYCLGSGAGVLATGWEIPDGVDRPVKVPYISASTHRPLPSR